MSSEQQLLAAIARITETLNLTLSLEQITQAVVDQCIHSGGAVGASVTLHETVPGRGAIVRQAGIQADVPPFEDQASTTGRPVVVAGLHVDGSSGTSEGANLAGMLVPIHHQSVSAGQLILLFSDRALITDHLITFASAAANLVATAIGNITRYEELSARNQTLHRYAQQIERVVEAGKVFHAGSELPAVYEDLVYAIQESVGYNIVVLSLVEDHNDELRTTVVAGAGLPLDRLRLLEAESVPWAELVQLMTPPAAIGNAFLIPDGGSDFQRRFVRSLGAELYLGPSDAPAGERAAFDVLCLPLQDSGAQPLGLICLAAPLDRRRPDLDTVRILEIFANQAAASIENVRLYHDTRTFAQQLAHLQEVSQNVLSEHDPAKRLQLLVRGLQATGWQRVLLFQFDDRRIDESRVMAAGYSDDELAVLAAEPVDAAEWRKRLADAGLQESRPVSGSYAPASRLPKPTDHRRAGDRMEGELLWLPIEDRNGRLTAVIQLDQPIDGRRLTLRALRHVDLFTRFTAAILENMTLVQDLQRLNQELDSRVEERTRQLADESERVKTLLRISSELTASLDRDRVLARALSLINESIGATEGYILLVEGETGLLKKQASLGEIPPGAAEDGSIGRLEAIARTLMGFRKPAIVNNLSLGSVGSLLVAPLTIGEEGAGLLMLLHDRPGHFASSHLELATAAATQVAQAMHNAELYDLIRGQAESLGVMMRDAQDEVAKTHSILESIGDGVLVAQADGSIILVNDSACSILNIGRDELLFAPLSALRERIEPDGDSWLDTLQELLSKRSGPGQAAIQTSRVTLGNRTYKVTLSAVRAGQRLVGSVSVLHDITREVEVDRLKSEFVSTVSHELRTPMTSVKGYSDLLLMGIAGELNATQESYLQVIKSNADRLGRLVDDLLDISRIETGKVELQLRAIRLSDIVAHMLDEQVPIKLRSKNKVLNVQADMPADLPAVVGDAEKVAQILANLLDNAISYTPSGGAICVSCQLNQSLVWTSVQDTGIGMTREQLSRIFDRFYRAGHSAVQGVAGTGLGLSIVQSLVELHGGEIRVTSRPDEGSTFMFSLPIAARQLDFKRNEEVNEPQ